MEKSIKRVERLVHATNSALAQMKLSLMFDDLNPEKRESFRRSKGLHPIFGEKFPDGDDLKQCQKDFNSEASEMLAKIEKMFGSSEISRKSSQALDRIKEINRKMKTPTTDHLEPGETHQSRQKLLSLIGEERFSPRGRLDSGKRSGEKPRCPPRKPDAVPEASKTPIKPREELKSKILETQEIVDRGFQTAKHLAHKVDSIAKCERKEKTPSTGKTGSEINVRCLDGKTESNETVITVKRKRDSGREKTKKRERGEVEGPVNAQVVDIKRKEQQKSKKSNLQVQRLPSVHIRGELQLQKIHSLEIPMSGDAGREKSNTAIAFLSHEQMKKEKMDEIVEKVRKENCFCTESDSFRNYVECYHCGKLIRVRQTRVDPRKVDEILQMCNFNVFDPRIEEFVEKYGNVNGSSWSENAPPLESARISAPATPEVKAKEIGGKIKTENQQPKVTKTDRRSTLRDLSDQLYEKYRQEADSLECNHLKLDSILKNIFRKVDQSREVFENCHLMKIEKFDSEKVANLATTRPILVSCPGDSSRIVKRRRKWEKEVKTANRIGSESFKIMMEGAYEPSAAPKSPEREKTGGRTSFIRANWDGVSETEKAKEEKLVTPSVPAGQTTRQPEIKQQEGERAAPATSTNKSRSKWKMTSRKQSTEKSHVMSSKTSKSPNWIFEQGDSQIGSFETTKKKTTESPGRRKEEGEGNTLLVSGEANAQGAAGTVEELEDVVPSVAVTKGLKEALESDEAERNRAISREEIKGPCEEKAPSEASSEKSENLYESDFESMTNEPEEHADEDETPELVPLLHKLSTISEVDSELEKKPGEAKASKGKTDKQEGNPIDSEISSRNKMEVTLPKTTEASLKSTPTELVTSLKDVLSALQDQFARTESLAEKLTESQKIERNPEVSSAFAEGMLSHWEIPIDTSLVEALKSARKSARKSASKQSKGYDAPEKSSRKTVDSLSDEGGSSLGEIIVSERRRRDSGKSQSSSISENSFLKHASARKSSRPSSVRRETAGVSGFKLGVNSEDASYSEGEIPSENLLDVDRFSTHSVGEISH